MISGWWDGPRGWAPSWVWTLLQMLSPLLTLLLGPPPPTTKHTKTKPKRKERIGLKKTRDFCKMALVTDTAGTEIQVIRSLGP